MAGQRHPCREGRKKKRKERLKGERKREGRRRRRRKEGPVSVLFRVIATRTEASKGFVLRFHSWVALRGLLSSALFCASFFLIDGRVNRSSSKTRVASSFRSSASAVARHAANLTLPALTSMRSVVFLSSFFFSSFLSFFPPLSLDPLYSVISSDSWMLEGGEEGI